MVSNATPKLSTDTADPDGFCVLFLGSVLGVVAADEVHLGTNRCFVGSLTHRAPVLTSRDTVINVSKACLELADAQYSVLDSAQP